MADAHLLQQLLVDIHEQKLKDERRIKALTAESSALDAEIETAVADTQSVERKVAQLTAQVHDLKSSCAVAKMQVFDYHAAVVEPLKRRYDARVQSMLRWEGTSSSPENDDGATDASVAPPAASVAGILSAFLKKNGLSVDGGGDCNGIAPSVPSILARVEASLDALQELIQRTAKAKADAAMAELMGRTNANNKAAPHQQRQHHRSNVNYFATDDADDDDFSGGFSHHPHQPTHNVPTQPPQPAQHEQHQQHECPLPLPAAPTAVGDRNAYGAAFRRVREAGGASAASSCNPSPAMGSAAPPPPTTAHGTAAVNNMGRATRNDLDGASSAAISQMGTRSSIINATKANKSGHHTSKACGNGAARRGHQQQLSFYNIPGNGDDDTGDDDRPMPPSANSNVPHSSNAVASYFATNDDYYEPITTMLPTTQELFPGPHRNSNKVGAVANRRSAATTAAAAVAGGGFVAASAAVGTRPARHYFDDDPIATGSGRAGDNNNRVVVGGGAAAQGFIPAAMASAPTQHPPSLQQPLPPPIQAAFAVRGKPKKTTLTFGKPTSNV